MKIIIINNIIKQRACFLEEECSLLVLLVHNYHDMTVSVENGKCDFYNMIRFIEIGLK